MKEVEGTYNNEYRANEVDDIIEGTYDVLNAANDCVVRSEDNNDVHQDKLQDDVKMVLNNFLEADINVWMLTGDQLDTAESIGYSCKLFNDDTEVYKLREGFKNEIDRSVINQI